MAHRRPMLSLRSHSTEALDAGQPARVLLSIGNVGHAHAIHVYCGVECLLINPSEDFSDDVLHALCEMRLRLAQGQLDPGGCLDLHFSLQHLHRAHVAAINQGERLLLILARLEYSGLDGNFHWSNICLKYDGRAITLHDERADDDASAFHYGLSAEVS